MAQCPMYVWKYQEPILSADRQKQINDEKLRFKSGATSVILRLNKELRAAFESQDLDESFYLAFRLQNYVNTHCKFFLRWNEKKKLEDAIYNIVGEFYLGMKWLDKDMSKDRQEERIYCMLGSEMADTPFIRGVKMSLMPHVMDKT